MIRTLLCALALAALALPQEAPGAGPDRIRLVTGEVLRGWILNETPTLVEIRLAAGMVVGLERSRAVEIHRSSPPPEPSAPPERPRLLAPVDGHFLVLDGQGRAIGTRRYLVQEERQKDGAWVWRLEENWLFQPGGEPLRLQRTEFASALLAPLSCLYRETSGSEERLVRAQVKGDRLEVQTLTPRGRQQARLPFPQGMRFPLLLRETLRQRERTGRLRLTAACYDPMADAIQQRELVTGLHRGPVRGPWGDWGMVWVVQEERDGRLLEEWLDAEGRTLYLEANGLDLAAVRCTADEARLQEEGRLPASAVPTLVRRGPGSLRLPDPAWAFLPGPVLAATCQDLQATVRLIALPGTGPGAPPEEAARQLGRWLALEGGELSRLEVLPARIGWGHAARLQGLRGVPAGERVEALVFPGPTGLLALVLQAPVLHHAHALAALEKAAPWALPSSPPTAVLPATPAD